MQDFLIENSPIFKLLSFHNIIPDFYQEIQPNSNKFKVQAWTSGISQAQNVIKKSKFLYIISKESNSDVVSLYIGKSINNKQSRLKQHFSGLNEIHSNPNFQNTQDFYSRMYSKLFQSDRGGSILLYIIKWENSKEIENFLPFPLSLNVSNAEAILISIFSKKFPSAMLNHEFVSKDRWGSRTLSFQLIKPEIFLNIEGENSIDLWNNWISDWFLIENNMPRKTPNNEMNNNEMNEKIVHIPLFQTDENLIVQIQKHDKFSPILQKSDEMIEMIMLAVQRVKYSYDFYFSNNENLPGLDKPLFTDGLVYMVYIKKSDALKVPQLKMYDFSEKPEIIPIYIGKTEATGRNGTWSANLKNVHLGKNPGYFARWGTDSARHMGGLSYRFFNIPNRYPSTDYEHWIRIIFDEKSREDNIPKLQIPVYFRMKPWYPFNIDFCGRSGIFTSNLETILISIARNCFPDLLSNKNGR